MKSHFFKLLLRYWCQDKDQVAIDLIHSDKVSYNMEKVYWKSLQHYHPTDEKNLRFLIIASSKEARKTLGLPFSTERHYCG